MPRKSTDILVVGKTGHGKSETANSLVGYKAFKSKSSCESVTKSAQFEYGEFEGRILKVVDGPGVGDTSLDSEDVVKLVVDAMSVAIAVNPAGYHTILLVVRFPSRFTKEEIACIGILKSIFGDDFIRCHAILVMTYGDNFNKEEDGSFENWINCQEGHFKEVINECGNRVVLFNNKTEDQNIKDEQIRKLLKIIDHLAGNGTRYTSDNFNKAKEKRDCLIKESKTVQLNQDTLVECGLISQKLSTVDYNHPEKEVVPLENLKSRTESLEQDIIKQDQGTNSLQTAILLAKQFNECTSEHMKLIHEVLTSKHQTEEKNLEQEMTLCRLDAEDKRKREEEYRLLEEKVKKDHEKRMEQMDQEVKKQLEVVKETYATVKAEESWTFESVASYLAGSAASTIKKWWQG